MLYADISNNIARLIKDQVLKPGDRLPSVRMLCQEYGISMNTAKRVFLELESQSLILSRPQSGYFVSQLPYRRLPLPEVSQPLPVSQDLEPEALISQFYATIGRQDLTHLSLGVLSSEMLPLAKLNKEIVQATRRLSAGGTAYEQIPGNENLRRMIAARSLSWGGNLTAHDIITTTGGINALAFCMMAAGKPGDTIAMESPCYPGTLQLARSLGLNVLELPTHPVTGVEVDALKKVIHKINLCLLVPNFNTPLGSCMPAGNKQAVVELLAKHGIPLIEDDIYGDLYFGAQRPTCCKTYDEEDNVLLCSSFSKTIAPGYRVGWVVPGRYREKILKLKLVHMLSAPTLVHEAVAAFLQGSRYDNHLRQLRTSLQQNALHYFDAIAAWFPPDTRVSQPQGGIALWVEFNKNINTTALFETAMKHKIAIAPGRMFSLQDQFENCMRLSLGVKFSAEVDQKLKLLGKLLT